MAMKFYRYTRSYRDRHGKLRVEYRRNGKTIPLPNSVGTAEFQSAYDIAKAMMEGGRLLEGDQQQPTPTTTGKPKSGTLRWLCVEYFKSAEFGDELSHNTQHARRLVLESMLREPLKPNSLLLFADCPVSRLEPKHVRVLRDRKKAFPESANIRTKTLRIVFKWAIENEIGDLTDNPARDVPNLTVSGDGHHSWSEQEREQFERCHVVGTKARLAYALIFYTGARRSDAVLLGPRHIQDGKLCFTQQKNRRRKPMSLELPILPELQQALDATSLGEFTFLVNGFGRPFTENGFGNKFHDWCVEAGLAHCSAHGLRKAAAARAAEKGATANELMAMFGWLTMKEAERYTRAAERKKLAQRGYGRLVPLKP